MTTCGSIKATEKSTSGHQLRFRDLNGVLAVPLSVDYRIDCPDILEGSQEIRDWTALGPPASTMQLVYTSSDLEIQRPDLTEERRIVSIRANYGTTDAVYSDIGFMVKNLQYVE